VSTNSFASNRGWLNSISNKKDTTELSAWSYSHNPSGDISSETGAGRTRAFTYDNAGRLTKTAQTGASAATRNYSYDANSNRCSTTTACDSSYDYDSADRLLASPSATAYSYDQHGSVTSATPTRATATYSPDLSGSVGAAQTKTETVAPSAAGTVSATLDWQPTTAEVQKDETVTALGQKDYTLKVSPNGTVAASVSWPSQTLNPNLDLILLDSSGAEVSSSKQLTGNSESISYAVTGIGTYPDSKTFTLRIKALATGSDFTLSYSHPATADLDLQLFNPSGTKVAESASSSTRPEAVSFNVTTGSAGDYSLKVVSKDFATAYSLSASYPRSPELKVSYDANDHATQTDDGTMVNKETLSPSGRVLRRVVTDPAGKVTEDTTFGYDDRGDSPAYSRPTGGGSIATYVEGPSGLLAIDTGGTPSYPISNAHGDIAGTTDANGNFTANPDSDEFGAGPQPSNRLGWLGAKQRYSTGGSLALIRMGVRLYDPSLGRFLQVDPVEGGSANDYDYGWQDPVNNLDLDGRAVMKPLRWLFKEANKHFTIRRGRPAFHWRNNQNRIEWDPKNRWHFNDDLARKGKHLSVRRGLWEASRRGATNGFRAAGRGLKAASRFLGSAPYLLVPIPGRLACRAVDNGSGSCRRPNYAA
ncbi:MAG: RHS repeat-associated core domain-containing protein, partial [Actinomycetota bacterium]